MRYRFSTRLLFTAALSAAATAILCSCTILPPENEEEWVTRGFEAFRRGEFENGGQNLYVSRAGILQRIYQYDLNGDGWFDLIFADCQNHHESQPATVIRSDGTEVSLLSRGTLSGTVADIDGDGFDDVVLAGYDDASAPYVASDIYFGSAEGITGKYHLQLPAPHAFAVAAGRFDGGKAATLVFGRHGGLRIFVPGEAGWEWRGFQDLKFPVSQLAAGDFDGDGYDDLAIFTGPGKDIHVCWGGPDGISLERMSSFPVGEEVVAAPSTAVPGGAAPGKVAAVRLFKSLTLNGEPVLVLSTGRKLLLFGSGADRNFTLRQSFEVTQGFAAAAGDIDGDGIDDLAVAARDITDSGQKSFIIWGGSGEQTALPTLNATDVAITATGEVVFAGGAVGRDYSGQSYCYRFSGRKAGDAKLIPGANARRVFAVRPGAGTDQLVFINHLSRSAVGCDSVPVYWGGADGYTPERVTRVPAWNGVDAIFADFDDDGRVEALICNNSEEALHLDPGHHLHRFGPDGFEPQGSRMLPVEVGWGAVTADFDRDGYLDIISVSDRWRGLRLFRGTETGFAEPEKIISTRDYGEARWILAVDLDRDGWLELAVPLISSGRTLVFRGGPEGYSTDRMQQLAVPNGSCARAADLDGNGYPELIVGGHRDAAQSNQQENPHQSFVHIYWNGPEGISDRRKSILRADGANSLAVADFNGDGLLDIFVGNYHNGNERDINSFIYWNRGGFFPENDRTALFTHSASGCLAADFNEDGRIDLAVANHKFYGDHRGFSSVWWSTPHGFTPASRTDLPTDGPHGMSAVEPGNQLDRSDGESYISEARRFATGIEVTGSKIEGAIPDKCGVELELRSAENETALKTAPWRSAFGFRAGAGELVQYRLTLRAKNSLRTPRISGVVIYYVRN